MSYPLENKRLHNFPPNLTPEPTHSVKRLYRRTHKVDAAEFYFRKHRNEKRTRHQPTEHALDAWLTQTFTQLYEKNRFDASLFSTKEALIIEGSRWGIRAKKIFYAVEALLNKASITETQLSSKSVWLFALYQTLRQLEHKEYHKQHVYTSLAGKTSGQEHQNHNPFNMISR